MFITLKLLPIAVGVTAALQSNSNIKSKGILYVLGHSLTALKQKRLMELKIFTTVFTMKWGMITG